MAGRAAGSTVPGFPTRACRGGYVDVGRVGRQAGFTAVVRPSNPATVMNQSPPRSQRLRLAGRQPVLSDGARSGATLACDTTRAARADYQPFQPADSLHLIAALKAPALVIHFARRSG